MDSHINILSAKTSLCMCEVEKKISEFLGCQIIFEEDGNLYIYSNSGPHEKIADQYFNSFLESVK